MIDDRKRKVSLDDARKKGPEEQMKKVVEDSKIPFEVAEWFCERIDFYKWDFESLEAGGKEYLDNVVDKHIRVFFDKFTKGYKEEYKERLFELFTEETKLLLKYNVEFVLDAMNTILFDDMKRRMLSEINFQLGVADYITEEHLKKIYSKKLENRYKDRIELVNSGSKYEIDYSRALRLYFKGYLFNNCYFIYLYNFPIANCWYKEGWGLMSWIYEINGGSKDFGEGSYHTYEKLYKSFMTCKNKKEFFEFLRKEKDYTRSFLDKFEAIEKARDRYIKRMWFIGKFWFFLQLSKRKGIGRI